MLFSAIVASIESSIMAIEAFNVVVMRTQMFAKGDATAVREAEIMISEKMEAFTQAGFDVAAGVSNKIIRDNFRAAVQANEKRLIALRTSL